MAQRKIQARLGIDVGRVLIAAALPGGGDTAFIGGSMADALATPAYEGMFEHVPELVERFEGRVWLVSKAGPSVQAKTRQWLRHHRFHERTGIPAENVRFCRERAQKRHPLQAVAHHAFHRRPRRCAAAPARHRAALLLVWAAAQALGGSGRTGTDLGRGRAFGAAPATGMKQHRSGLEELGHEGGCCCARPACTPACSG